MTYRRCTCRPFDICEWHEQQAEQRRDEREERDYSDTEWREGQDRYEAWFWGLGR